LLDSEILAEVYLELIGGRQPDFALTGASPDRNSDAGDVWVPRPRKHPLPSRLTEKEAAAHADFVAKLGDGALWLKT
jgi:DNA polymerase-3 subunit epsilon